MDCGKGITDFLWRTKFEAELAKGSIQLVPSFGNLSTLEVRLHYPVESTEDAAKSFRRPSTSLDPSAIDLHFPTARCRREYTCVLNASVPPEKLSKSPQATAAMHPSKQSHPHHPSSRCTPQSPPWENTRPRNLPPTAPPSSVNLNYTDSTPPSCAPPLSCSSSSTTTSKPQNGWGSAEN